MLQQHRTSIAITLLAILPGAVLAQAYPNKPIRLIIPFGTGGPGDAIGRMIGRQLTESLGHPVVIDNRSGATTIIGTELAAKSPPDGHTLLLISTTHAVNPALFRKLPYDPTKDFAPVTLITATPFMLGSAPCRSSEHSAGFDCALAQQTRRTELRLIGRRQFHTPHHRVAEISGKYSIDPCPV